MNVTRFIQTGFLMFFFAMTTHANAQVSDTETAVCNVFLSFDEQMKGTVGLLPEGPAMEIGGFTISDGDSERITLVEKMLKDSSFHLLMKRLDEETDLSILPIETLAPHIMYLKDGYPFQNGFKKAAKATDYKQFLKIEIQVTAWTTSTTTNTQIVGGTFGDPIESETEFLAVKPLITVFLKFGDSNGKKIATLKGIHKSQNYVRSQQTKLSSLGVGMIRREIESLEFYKLYNEALSDLITKINASQ